MIQTAVAATAFAGFVEAPFRRLDAASNEPQGLALCIGLNEVDSDRYDGWDGRLNGCVNDATQIERIAKNLGYYDTKLLRDGHATIDEVRRHIRWAAHDLRPGDIFLLSCSSHGGTCADTNGDEEDDRQDETWCLYDGQWIDDDRYDLFREFQPGVRIVMIGDMCHSGTTARAMRSATLSAKHASDAHEEMKETQEHRKGSGVMHEKRPSKGVAAARDKYAHREFSTKLARDLEDYQDGMAKVTRAYRQGKYQGDSLGRAFNQLKGRQRVRALPEPLAESLSDKVDRFKNPMRGPEDVRASGLLLAACQDDQTALDGDENGLFTGTLLGVWEQGGDRDSYQTLFNRIKSALRPYFGHAPNFYAFGAGGNWNRDSALKIR